MKNDKKIKKTIYYRNFGSKTNKLHKNNHMWPRFVHKSHCHHGHIACKINIISRYTIPNLVLKQQNCYDYKKNVILAKIVSNSPSFHGCILWKIDTASGYIKLGSKNDQKIKISKYTIAVLVWKRVNYTKSTFFDRKNAKITLPLWAYSM